MTTFNIEEIVSKSQEFIQEYRASLVSIGHTDPGWTDEDVKTIVRKLLHEENYEDLDHIEMVFARDLIYTLETRL